MSAEPRILVWRVTRADGSVLTIETRDIINFVNDTSNATDVDGACAEVPWRDPASAVVKYRDSTSCLDRGDTREMTHRRAIDALAHANRWGDVSAEQTGVVR